MAKRIAVLVSALALPAAGRAQCPDGTPPPCAARPGRGVVAAPANSVAVLYFENQSRDTADAYLADGLTEEVIARLGQVERLSVKSRGAVRRFRGQPDADPAVVGRALGVANLVSGSVRRAGNQLRVTVEMVRAANGVHVWGDVFTRGDGDVFAIQEDIARSVATQVAGRLAPEERAALAARPTRSAEAYDHFLRGNFYLAQRNPGQVRRAIAEYESAAQLDPAFTTAQARIAVGLGVYLSWGWDWPGLSRDSVLTLGFAAANRVLRRDSSDADAWMALAMLRGARNPLTLAGERAANERAVALDPRKAEALHQLAWTLAMLGRDSAATVAYRRALAIEPGRAITYEHLARLARAQQRDADAALLLDSAIASDPGFLVGYMGRGILRARLGDVAGARADADVVAGLNVAPQTWVDALRARVATAQGDTASARRLLRASPLWNDGTSLIFSGPALVAVGEQEHFFELLASAQTTGDVEIVWLRMRDYDAVRNDPRFARFIEAVQAARRGS